MNNIWWSKQRKQMAGILVESSDEIFSGEFIEDHLSLSFPLFPREKTFHQLIPKFFSKHIVNIFKCLINISTVP